jgi:penicillin-binding protein 1A
MNTFPTLRLKGMTPSRQVLAAARFLPGALEAIRNRRLSVPASFFVAAEDGRTVGISYGDVVFTAQAADLRRIQEIVVALEDRRFYRHRGIDFRGIVRAGIANTRAWKVVQGGSTITQQLVRNTLLAPDRSPIRKICEVLFALEVERHYSKAEILDLYCHHVFLGNGTRGFPAAAKVLYRRPLRTLDDGQLVALAGLLRTPSRTHPIGSSAAYVKRAAALTGVLGTAPGMRNVAPANPTDPRRLLRSRHTPQIRTEIQGLDPGKGEIARVTTSLQPTIQTS